MQEFPCDRMSSELITPNSGAAVVRAQLAAGVGWPYLADGRWDTGTELTVRGMQQPGCREMFHIVAPRRPGIPDLFSSTRPPSSPPQLITDKSTRRSKGFAYIEFSKVGVRA